MKRKVVWLLMAVAWIIGAAVGAAVFSGCGADVSESSGAAMPCSEGTGSASDTSSTGSASDTSSTGPAVCATPIDACPDVDNATLLARCLDVFPGSTPALYQPGACGAPCDYPPVNAANIGEIACGPGSTAWFWCRK